MAVVKIVNDYIHMIYRSTRHMVIISINAAVRNQNEEGGGEEGEGVFVLLRETTASFPLRHSTLEASPCSPLGSVPVHDRLQGFY